VTLLEAMRNEERKLTKEFGNVQRELNARRPTKRFGKRFEAVDAG
jgi:hypothetical protein